MKQCNLTKGFVVFLTITITLFCGVMPSSWAGSDYCDDLNLQGYYGFSHDGMMLMRIIDKDGNPVIDKHGAPVYAKLPTPMASVGVLKFDASIDGSKDGSIVGSIDGHEMVQFGTDIFPATLSGTIRVKSDCTGTAWICATPTIPEGNIMGIRSEISFVITGDEIQMLTIKMTHCVNNEDTGVDAATPLNIVGNAKKQCAP